MSTDKNGATINPHKQPEVDACPQLDGRRGRHHFIWCHEPNGNCVQCGHCGEIRENTINSDKVLMTGKVHDVDPVQP